MSPITNNTHRIIDKPCLHIVLYQPEIPSNTGNIARLCAATEITLHLIHPLRFRVDDFSAKLPWFYHDRPFDPPQEHAIHSFEVNGLPPGLGTCAATLLVPAPRDCVEVSRDGHHFERIPVHRDLVPLPTFDLSRRMLSLYFRSGSPDQRCPIASINFRMSIYEGEHWSNLHVQRAQ